MLEKYLTLEVFIFITVFARVGACVMLLPGFGEAYVPPRIRLVLALAISLAIAGVVKIDVPKTSPAALLTAIGPEIMVGLLLGGMARMFSSAIHTGGMIIAMQAGLGQAVAFDPNQSAQGAEVGNFMSYMSVALIFASGLDHLMIKAMAESYGMFSPLSMPSLEDAASLAVKTIATAFMVAVKMASPFIVIGLLMNLGAGLLARLMPAIQIFFIMMPLQIAISFLVFMTTLAAAMLVYLEAFRNEIGWVSGGG